MSNSKLLEINWKPKSYEYVLLVFALICFYLVHFLSPLIFSWQLARVFIFKLCQIIILVYALSFIVIFFKACFIIKKSGFQAFKTKGVIKNLCFPYNSLDFLIRNIRRTLAIFATIFFFLHLKHVILWINTSNFDLFLWDLDRFLHLGYQPNVYLMNLLGENKEIAITIDWLYIKYFDYKMLVCICFLLELKGKNLSEAFFLAYTLIWSIGGLAYLALPSDGPCYSVLLNNTIPKEYVPAEGLRHRFKFPVVRVDDDSYYKKYTEAIIPSAKAFQVKLWLARQKFLTGKGFPGMFYGIAAMPSLHNSAVMMLFIFLCYLSGYAGIAGFIYVLATYFGSIFLQWHYAVDAYIGWLIAIIISLGCIVFYKRDGFKNDKL